MKIVIFGAGRFGRQLKKYLDDFTDDKVIAMLDNDNAKCVQGGDNRAYPAEYIKDLVYDKIIISNRNEKAQTEIFQQLLNLGVEQEKIQFFTKESSLFNEALCHTNAYPPSDSRINWISSFADYVHAENLAGDVAECGVNRAECAFYINKYFFDRKCYLFDTFTGFSEADLEKERGFGDEGFLDSGFNDVNCFNNGITVDYLSRKLPFFDQCVIRKGYFPNTAIGIEGPFCFVNLDMDLYQPMLAGLEFFYDKMIPSGIILMHDYFDNVLSGVKRAVNDFEAKIGHKLARFPIGDRCSIAIIKSLN